MFGVSKEGSRMPFGDEDETGEIKPASGPVDGHCRRHPSPSVKANPTRSPIFHPLAYRGVVAEWPVEWRERWGRRANAWKKTGSRGAMPKHRHSWKSGTRFAGQQSAQTASGQHVARRTPNETKSCLVTGILSLLLTCDSVA